MESYFVTAIHYEDDICSHHFYNPALKAISFDIEQRWRRDPQQDLHALLAALDGAQSTGIDVDGCFTLHLVWDSEQQVLKARERPGIRGFVESNWIRLVDELPATGKGKDEIWLVRNDLESRFQRMRKELFDSLKAPCYRVTVEAGNYAIGFATSFSGITSDDVLSKARTRTLLEEIIIFLEQQDPYSFCRPRLVYYDNAWVLSQNAFSWSIEANVLHISTQYIPTRCKLCQFTEKLILTPLAKQLIMMA